MSLAYVINPLLVLITLRSVSVFPFLKFGEIQKLKIAYPRWPPFGNHMTSSLPVMDLKGNIFRHAIYTLSLIVVALILAKLWTLWPKRQKKKKLGLDRVNSKFQSQ